jgi:PEP-CTERM motif
MRLLLAACVLTACAGPLAAGPLDPWQYRTTLVTDLSPGTGPALQPGETAYPLGADPAHGVIAAGVADWAPAYPAYPGAGFSVVTVGRLTPYIAADNLRGVNVTGGGQFALDVELRDAAGRTGVVSFRGRFDAGWSDEFGHASPVWTDAPSGSVWLGGTRYDVRLDYGWPPQYMQMEDGSWVPVRYAVDPALIHDGDYWSMTSGVIFATVTPTATPEPGTLALAGLGLGGLLLRRRVRRSIAGEL